MQKKHAPVHAPVQNYDNDDYDDDDDDDCDGDDDEDDDDDDDGVLVVVVYDDDFYDVEVCHNYERWTLFRWYPMYRHIVCMVCL